MSRPREATDISKRVYDLVLAYANQKTKAKCGLEWSDFRHNKIVDPASGSERVNVPEPYRAAREKVCADAFLRMRSCRNREDFANFFTGTICSVPQFLPLEEYQQIGHALLDDSSWEEIKALAMLALSGLSRV